MNDIYKIGLDVATKTTGIVIIKNEELIHYGTINTDFEPHLAYGQRLMMSCDRVDKYLAKNLLREFRDNQNKMSIKIGIEVSTVQRMVGSSINQTVIQKLSYYAGLYAHSISNFFAIIKPKVYYGLEGNTMELKILTAREWQLKVFNRRPLNREQGKAESLRLAKYYSGIDFKIDDIADAYHIARNIDELRDTILVRIEKQNRSEQLLRLRRNAKRYESMIKKYELIKHEREKQGLMPLTKTQSKVLDYNKKEFVKAVAKIKELREWNHTSLA